MLLTSAPQAHVRGMLAKKQYKAMLVRFQDETAQSVTMLAGLSQMSEQSFSAQMALLDEESRRGPEGLGLVKKAKKKPKAKKKRTSDVETEQKRFEKDLAKARKGVIKWWMKSERPRNMHVNKDGGKVRLYFHGLISRHQAEEYLMYVAPCLGIASTCVVVLAGTRTPDLLPPCRCLHPRVPPAQRRAPCDLIASHTVCASAP